MSATALQLRPADRGDAGAIAAIHTEGIVDRVATFRTEPRTAIEVEHALTSGLPCLVAESGGRVIGWAGVSPYDDAADYYAGVGEATVYVARDARGGRSGRALLEALEAEASAAGYFKLVAKVFDTNEQSLRLFGSSGWRTVGTHRRHGRLDGEWKDVVLLEKELA